MWAEQAIFTSLPRLGKAGYHLVARSPGVTDSEAKAITTWSPSHGALIVDDANQSSVSFHRLPSGRFALARTCEGLPEYSGRGGRQLYTHTLIVDDQMLKRGENQPFAVYRDALALGYYCYRPNPEATLSPVPLSALHRPKDTDFWTEHARSLGLASYLELREQLSAQRAIELNYPGDRAVLAECLIGLLDPESRLEISFATSLRPSMVRPYQLVLLGAA
jgi:hypothetical protein